MTIQDRITISSEDTIRNLEQNLDKLRRFQYDGQYRRLLGNTLVNHMEDWDEKIRTRRKDPFTIVVVGEFKRGKSSFINALVGEEILVTDVVPETVTMNRLNYGIHKNEAVLSGGRRLSLNDDELSRSALEKLSGEVGEQIRQLELWRPLDALRDVRIIDTPGLNDVEDDYLDAIVADAMAQADAVIYVYSVATPLSRSEQMYIRYAILPQHYTKMFLVGNYSDLLATETDLERMRNLMKERTQILLPGEKTYLISALDEMCRIGGQPRPCEELAPLLEQGFAELRGDILDLINEKKTTVAADRMQRLTRQMVDEIEADLTNIEKALDMNASQLAEEQDKLRLEEQQKSAQLEGAKAKIHDKVVEFQADTAEWIADLITKMEHEDLSIYSAHEISQYYGYYCAELLETALRACLEMHREDLLEQLSDISDELGSGLAGMYASGDKIRFCFRVNSTTWTKGDSVVMAVHMVGNNTVFAALADLVGGLSRKTEVEADKGRLLEDIRRKYPAFKANALQNVESQYADMERSACALMEEYYQGQLERAAETVAQYEEISQKCEEDKAQVLEIVTELRETLSVFREDEIRLVVDASGDTQE